jgi:cytochrome c
MNRHALACLTTAYFALTAGAASAQNGPPDISGGRELAERLCAICHAVTPEPASGGRPDVPSFAAVAKSPNATPERLAGAIILPHPAMPGVPLTRAEIRDIIAYIMSLKPQN